MKGITALIEVYNEEKRLPYTLKSLTGFDEIVILDKSSTDRTAEIGREFGAKVYTLPYYDGRNNPDVKQRQKEIFSELENEWVFGITASDIVHPALYKCMVDMINSKECDAVEIPLYRYSMGYVSKYSYYGDITYQAKLVKKELTDWETRAIHSGLVSEERSIIRLEPEDKNIAIYHLTHENLDMVMERHLRYARLEADIDRTNGSRKEYLKRSWHSILRVIKNYVCLRTYKLGDEGKAQLAMLLMYRSANYLHLYFSDDKEKEIHDVYEKIRTGEMWK